MVSRTAPTTAAAYADYPPPSYEETNKPPPRTAALALRPYQEEALAAIAREHGAGITRQLVALPTGTGKTVCFATLARARGGRTLVVAHRDELIRQAAEKLHLVDPAALIGVVKADEDAHDRPVVVASVQTLARPQRLARLARDFATVVVDEAHHAAAESYGAVLAYLRAFEPGGPLVVGFTATPERGDGVGLDAVFQKIVYRRGLGEMIQAGYLCDLRGIRVQVAADFGTLHSRGGDIVAGESAAALLDANAPAHIAGAYLEHAAGRKALCFTPTVAVAELVAAAFLRAGVAAESVDATTPLDERRAILARFRDGTTRVLANCGVLTEGYDEPSVDCVIIARPTRSRTLYAQMIGRGTRLYPGKVDCLVLDVVGATQRHDLQTLGDLFGLPPRAIASEGVAAALARRAAPPDLVSPTGELTARAVDLFNRRALAWVQVDARRFTLSTGDGQLTLEARGAGWDVFRSARGSWERQAIAAGLDFGYAMGMAEDVARRAGAGALVDRAAPWRLRPASPKQRDALDRMHIPYRAGLTAGQASDLIQAAIAGRR